MIHASEELAIRLLDDYRAGSSFFLSSSRHTLLAEGAIAAVPRESGPGALERLPKRVAALLGAIRPPGYGSPVVVGAIPFDHAAPAQLVVPASLRRAGPLNFGTAERMGRPPATAACTIRPVPEPELYVRGVERGLTRLRAGELDKIVLSRSLHLSSPTDVDIGQLLRRLAGHNALGYTFAVDLPARDTEPARQDVLDRSLSRRTLIGASPELLVSRTGLRVTANPLAGSAPRSDDPAEDRRRACALLDSPKDLHEHAVVVDAVAAALRPYCRKLDVPAKPSLVQTAAMWHLSSEIHGELVDGATSSLALAVALHPTPAVCGAPTELAREAIRELEPFDRGYYTGMVGWCDAAGDGEWIVTIRCAEVADRSLRLFAGAGIVAESSAAAELAETSAKFRTMLSAMGLAYE
ncbi:isochorismate synthase DhbC [Paenibacillus mesophilus]|uniref:isochorismate synthase DhbC n=1 Tax=Paenibacillus mesophilus TaxID=2582849 RepID=UPI00110F3478|nr:isochorismate synthase DhbC [Paenibacillus mesophilus]TMV45534.1 isochorismate synthase DhbC [Paenibacillus mesophilus]